MSALLDELSKKAQSLAVEERAQLAQELLESVERDVDPDVHAAWEAEIADRIAKYGGGVRPSSSPPKRSLLRRVASRSEAGSLP